MGERVEAIAAATARDRAQSPRATADVDVAAPTRVPRQELVSRLIAAGFTLSGEHEHSLNFRHPGGEPARVAFDPEFDVMTDPAARKSKALRDRADVELLRGDVEGPDEGW